MTPTLVRLLYSLVAVLGILAGLVLLGSSNQYESNLGVGLFVLGGVAGLLLISKSGKR
ncbi:MAG TPA: hypothetical protein VGC18_13740 [Lacisediminihabitans sp.]|uniref:hypothetical protein n=1 Tax=Lacisediminihabitans sp. TaxID=2787631 RepID=UPI002EDB8FE8